MPPFRFDLFSGRKTKYFVCVYPISLGQNKTPLGVLFKPRDTIFKVPLDSCSMIYGQHRSV